VRDVAAETLRISLWGLAPWGAEQNRAASYISNLPIARAILGARARRKPLPPRRALAYFCTYAPRHCASNATHFRKHASALFHLPAHSFSLRQLLSNYHVLFTSNPHMSSSLIVALFSPAAYWYNFSAQPPIHCTRRLTLAPLGQQR